MLPQEIIRAKRDGRALTADQIGAYVRGVTDGTVTEGQIAAFSMAVFFRGMSREEAVGLTLAMRDSGTVLRLATAGRASGRGPVHAPVAGVVTELAIREGAMVTPDMMAMTITELGSLWVIAEVPESQAGWVAQGTAAELRFPSLPGETLQGRVQHVYPELNMETRTVRARIVLERPNAAIRANMLAISTAAAAESTRLERELSAAVAKIAELEAALLMATVLVP
jgi:multidrug efflux pump subunit AcrA (membrane-fusion protein)